MLKLIFIFLNLFRTSTTTKLIEIVLDNGLNGTSIVTPLLIRKISILSYVIIHKTYYMERKNRHYYSFKKASKQLSDELCIVEDSIAVIKSALQKHSNATMICFMSSKDRTLTMLSTSNSTAMTIHGKLFKASFI